MKKNISGIIFLFLALSLAACNNTVTDREDKATPDNTYPVMDTTPTANGDKTQQAFYDSINKIALTWSLRSPPRSYEDDLYEPEHWLSETVFYLDGRVQYTEKSYHGIVLQSDEWKIDPIKFQEFVGTMEESGIHNIPYNF